MDLDFKEIDKIVFEYGGKQGTGESALYYKR